MQSALERVGLEETSLDNGVGVWTREGQKVASIGIQIRNWVTMHGFAINVTNNLEPFKTTEICGQSNIKVSRVCDSLPTILNVSMLIAPLVYSFEGIMNMQLTERHSLEHISELQQL